MRLPFFKKKVKPEYFLALLLREEKVTAVVFEEYKGLVKFVGKHEENFETSIEHAMLDEWLEVLDKAISSAENNLPQNIETQKTVFGVKENWVEDAKIKKEYLLKLKKVCETLGLTPIGFLVIQEAIAHLLQKEEGLPPSAILIEVGNRNLSLSLLKAGNIIETKRTRIEDSIPKTTDRLLHHFTAFDVLPSRIILFNIDDEENLSQQFIGHQWSKSLPFLHVPKTTSLPKGFDAKAVLFGAATQMGFEMLDEKIDKITEEDSKSSHSGEFRNAERDQNPPPEKYIETPMEDFGFVRNQDVAKMETSKEAKKTESDNLEINTKIQHLEEKEDITQEPKEPEDVKINEPKIIHRYKKSLFVLILSAVSKTIKTILPLLFLAKSNAGLLLLPFKKQRKLILILPLIIIFLTIFILFYIFIPKAKIIISIDPKIVDKSQEVIISTKSKSDFSKNIISGELISIQESGKLSMPTTGKKEVGEKAKGTVTIYSRFSEEKTFPKDTIITSSNNLEFTLDNSVTLASSSGDASSQPSIAKASITAKNIGKESNLPSSTKFNFGSIPSITAIAKNETAFSGGTKKEINIVAKEDLDKLTTQAINDLEEKAKKEISKNVTSGKSIIPIFVDKNFDKKEFNKKIGDEASDVSIAATISYQLVSYTNNDFEAYSKDILKDHSNMILIDRIKYDLENIRQEKEDISALLKIKASYMPNIDKEKITAQITGKQIKESEEILSKLPEVSDIEISVTPQFPLLPKALPRISKNISIEIIANE